MMLTEVGSTKEIDSKSSIPYHLNTTLLIYLVTHVIALAFVCPIAIIDESIILAIIKFCN